MAEVRTKPGDDELPEAELARCLDGGRFKERFQPAVTSPGVAGEYRKILVSFSSGYYGNGVQQNSRLPIISIAYFFTSDSHGA